MQRAWKGLQREKVEEEVGGEVESGDVSKGRKKSLEGKLRDEKMSRSRSGS